MAKKATEEEENLDRWVKDLLRENGTDIPGLAICIRDAQGTVIFNKAYGVSDRDTGAPLQNDLIFPVASQSKTFTAAAVLLLAERGLVDLDSKLTDHLPQFKDPRLDDVTLRDALSHNTVFHPGFWPQKIDAEWPTSEKLRKMDIKDPRQATFANGPGYSNSMYSLLGLVVEDVTGMPFTKFAQTELLDKNGIKGVYAGLHEVPPELRGKIPTGYNDSPGTQHPKSITSDSEAGTPACGFFATPEGVSQFFHKLFNGGILKPETVAREMATRVNGAHGLGTSLINTDDATINKFPNPMFMGKGLGDMIGHAGDENGYSSDTRFNLKSGFTVTVLRTRGDEDADYAWNQALNDRIGVKKISAAAFGAFTGGPMNVLKIAPDEYGRSSATPLPVEEKNPSTKSAPTAEIKPTLRA